MRIGVMLGDVARSLFRRPVTREYPSVKHPAPPTLRGALWFRPETCTGCGICVKDCPANAIELFTIDKKARRFVLTYYVDRCTFCAQCVKSCNNKSLGMAPDQWELAALNRENLKAHFGKEEDVRAFLEGAAREGTGAPSPD
ncbi:MAG: 4Fe-4S dicluster domain-containing protein [Rudaea sp.]